MYNLQFQSVLTYITVSSEQLNEEGSQGQLPILPRKKTEA